MLHLICALSSKSVTVCNEFHLMVINCNCQSKLYKKKKRHGFHLSSASPVLFSMCLWIFYFTSSLVSLYDPLRAAFGGSFWILAKKDFRHLHYTKTYVTSCVLSVVKLQMFDQCWDGRRAKWLLFPMWVGEKVQCNRASLHHTWHQPILRYLM